MNFFKALIARTLLRLPEKWIYRIAGGAPVEIAGRVMDPHSQLIAYLAGKGSTFEGKTVEQARAMMREAMAMAPAELEPGVDVEDSHFIREKAQIPVRIYHPHDQDPKACVLVYFHAGGGVLGDMQMCHAFCSLLARAARRPVISVGYRLAPEHPWPSGLNDCVGAYQWALAQAEHLGAPEGRAAVGGDSMGGNYAAAICQEMKKEGAPAPEFQLLIYPSLDFAHQTKSMTTYRGVYPMTQDMMDFLMPRLISEGVNREDPRLSPLCNTDLSDLPPALIFTAGFDVLQDQGRLYHERLEQAGSESRLICFETLTHGFISMMGISPAARAACETIAQAVVRKGR